MEGLLFIIKAWALSGLGLWFYRRFFERVGKPVPEFEAWSRAAPMLAALRGSDSALRRVEAALLARLGKRASVVATLGGWPWPNYALRIRVARKPAMLVLRVTSAELLRAHGAPPPSLIEMLRELATEQAFGGESGDAGIEEIWLCAGAFYGKHGSEQAKGGWLLEASARDDPRPRLVPREASPDWLPKLLPSGAEC